MLGWTIVRVVETAITCKTRQSELFLICIFSDLFSPSRWEAQADAVNLIFSAKTQANPESSVGLMNMAGKGPEMLVTLTTDFGKLLDGMHRTKIRGSTHLATAIQIAGVWLRLNIVSITHAECIL